MADQILDVDLAAFETGSATARRAVVDGVRRSLATGFVYVRHDLSNELLDEAYAKLREFFGLPQAIKERSAENGKGQSGYTGLLVETAAQSDIPDWKEMINWGEHLDRGHPLHQRYPHHYRDLLLPEADVPGIERPLSLLSGHLRDLQRRFLRIVAIGVGASEQYFDDLLTDGSFVNRAIRYPPMASAPHTADVWADGHADINLTTALPRPTGAGLEVRTDDGWVPAAPPEGAVIINTGFMLERVTNGLIAPGWHRVVAGADESSRERYSIVQFCHPASWMMLSPLPSCVDAGHPCRFGTIAAGDLRDRVTWEINMAEFTPDDLG